MKFTPATFRPAFGRVLSVAVAAVAIVALVSLAVTGGPFEVLRYGWAYIFAAAVCWAIFWRPMIHIDEHLITVRNVFRTHRISWPAIRRIDTRFSLTLETAARTISVWAAPAPSRHSVLAISRNDIGTVRESARIAGSIRPGDAPDTASGAPAYVIRSRWEDLRDDGLLDDDAEVLTQTHWATIGVLAILLAATIAGAAL